MEHINFNINFNDSYLNICDNSYTLKFELPKQAKLNLPFLFPQLSPAFYEWKTDKIFKVQTNSVDILPHHLLFNDVLKFSLKKLDPNSLHNSRTDSCLLFIAEGIKHGNGAMAKMMFDILDRKFSSLEKRSKIQMDLFRAHFMWMEGNEDDSIKTLHKVVEETDIIPLQSINALARISLIKSLKWKGNYKEALSACYQLINVLIAYNESPSMFLLKESFAEFECLFGLQFGSTRKETHFYYQQIVQELSKRYKPLIHAFLCAWYGKRLVELGIYSQSQPFFHTASNYSLYNSWIEAELLHRDKPKVLEIIAKEDYSERNLPIINVLVDKILESKRTPETRLNNFISLVNQILQQYEKDLNKIGNRKLLAKLYLALSFLYSDLKKPEESYKCLEQGISKCADHGWLLLEYQLRMIENKKIADPIDSFKALTEKYADLGELHYGMAKFLFEKENISEGFSELIKAMELTPEFGDSFILYSHYLSKFPRNKEEIFEIRSRLFAFSDKWGTEWRKNANLKFINTLCR